MRHYSKMVRKLMPSFLMTILVFTLILALVGYAVVRLGGSVTQLPGLGIFLLFGLCFLMAYILRLSKLENQASLNEPVTYRLDEQIRECIVMLEPKWSTKDIGFELDLPEQTYTGQRSLLFQVWTNIISNAINSRKTAVPFQ